MVVGGGMLAVISAELQIEENAAVWSEHDLNREDLPERAATALLQSLGLTFLILSY
jgi:hypothetical protein